MRKASLALATALLVALLPPPSHAVLGAAEVSWADNGLSGSNTHLAATASRTGGCSPWATG